VVTPSFAETCLHKTRHGHSFSVFMWVSCNARIQYFEGGTGLTAWSCSWLSWRYKLLEVFQVRDWPNGLLVLATSYAIELVVVNS
jgi:hypothetical protein